MEWIEVKAEAYKRALARRKEPLELQRHSLGHVQWVVRGSGEVVATFSVKGDGSNAYRIKLGR